VPQRAALQMYARHSRTPKTKSIHMKSIILILGLILSFTSEAFCGYYVVIRGVRQVEGTGCLLVRFSIYNDRGTVSDRSDDIQVGTYTAALGDCDFAGGNFSENEGEELTFRQVEPEFSAFDYRDLRDYLEFSLPSDYERLYIEVTDLSGKTLYRDVVKNYQKRERRQIRKEELPQGLYLLNVRSEEGYYKTIQFVKF
jgi:hypothetical protein